MKRIFSIAICLICVISLSDAQVVVNPIFDRSDVAAFRVQKVEITKDTTFVYCSYSAEAESWANISKGTYLYSTRDCKKYPLLKCVGLPYAPQQKTFRYDERIDVLLCFPSVEGLSKFDIIENEGEKAFNIYGVNITKRYNVTYRETEVSRFANMASFYDSARDTLKALQFATKEVEAAKYLFGEMSKFYISKINLLAELYNKYGQFEQALKYREQSAIIWKEICNRLAQMDAQSGANSYYLQNIDFFYGNQVTTFRFFYDRNEWNEAKCHIQNVYHILQAREGTKHYIPIVLYYIGISSYYAKNEIDAERYFLLSYDSFQKHDEAKQYPVYGELLSWISLIYYDRGEYNKAYGYAQESCDANASILGNESKEYAFALAALSNAEIMLNKKQEALLHAELASEIIEKANDATKELKETYRNRIYAIKNVLNEASTTLEGERSQTDNITVAIFEAENNALSGNLNSSIQKLYKIRDYQEEHFESTSLRDYIRVIVTLADALIQIGRLNDADSILEGAITMLQKHQVTTNQVRYIYCSKGLLCYALKDNVAALEWYKKSIDLFHQVNDNSISYAYLLSNISIINTQIGYYKEANEQLEEAYDIIKKFYAENANDAAAVLLVLNNLATNYVKMGNISRGIEIYTSIITDATHSRNLRVKALAMNNLAEQYILKEDFDKAKKILAEVTTLDVDGYIKEMAEFNLLFCLLKKKDASAIDKLNAYNKKIKRLVSEVFGRFSESERENYWTHMAAKMIFLNNFAVLTFDSPETRRVAYDNALYTKSMLLNSGRLLGNIVKRSEGSVKESYEMMRVLKEKMSNKGNSKDSIESYMKKINNIEKQIIASFPDFEERLNSQFKSYSDVKNQLSDNDVAIEFIFLPQIKLPIEESELMYGALILTKRDDAPKIVPLCRDKDLNELICRSDNNIDSLYDIQNKKLYDLIWNKIEPYIHTGSNVYYSPAGDISKINLSAISDGTLRLMDRFRFYEVSSTALVGNTKQSTVSQVHSAAIFGDIDYYTDTDKMAKESNIYKSYSSGPLIAARSVSRNTWDLLPGSEKEITVISDILKEKGIIVKLLSKNIANEESFKALNACAPDIIHIATHGFYFPNKVGANSNFFSDVKSYTFNDSHLLYCGLLFSGANNVWTGKSITTNVEDGILTANEISHIDLNNVSLAVLSACETGLGDVSKIDGVLGLQYGFKRAGVGAILMSLWKVDDEATRILMEVFYRNLMNGKTKHESLQEAQQYLQKVENGKYNNPKYWASFIMLDGLN